MAAVVVVTRSSGPPSEIELGLFEQLAHAEQEAVRGRAVDGTVIVGNVQVHHRTDHDFTRQSFPFKQLLTGLRIHLAQTR